METLAWPGVSTLNETGIDVTNTTKMNIQQTCTVTPYGFILSLQGQEAPNRKKAHDMKTIEITVTGFNFKTGEYTTHTETVELN